MKGRMFVISGPSGCGKSTISSMLLKKAQHLKLSVSATTRKPRENEIEGEHYYFLTKDNFEKLISQNAFYEYAKVFENYYGTPVEPVKMMLEQGYDVLLEIDVQGALQIKNIDESAVLIFIMPPSLDVLKQRLISRNSESDEQLSIRLNEAATEIDKAVYYDFIVINDKLEECFDKVYEIYTRQSCS